MTNLVTMRVQLVAYTHFDPPTDLGWETDAEGSEALTEFAGRACYETWDKPNPHTATNAGYIRHRCSWTSWQDYVRGCEKCF